MAGRPKEKNARRGVVSFRVNPKEKELLERHFGSIAGVRDYALEVVEGKGDKVKREAKK
jgi:flagellar biosynthesis/type III secretory pathway protein FliH